MKILQGDCLLGMKTLPDNSVDAIVTDPPYGLSFMGKKWDYDVPSQEIWEEALRVLKPGGYLLAFAGTRTQHRMAVRIEDAGFEIRDLIFWTYASGFPKSLNIFKQLRKKCTCGAMEEYERTKKIPKSFLRFMPEADLSQTIPNQKAEGEVLQSGVSEQGLEIQQPESTENVWGKESGVEGRDNAKENSRELSGDNLCEMPEGISADGKEGRICDATQIGNGSIPKEVAGEDGSNTSHRPQSEEQQDREPCAFCKQYGTQAMGTLGYGTALKPACEPISVCRKPLQKGLNISENVLKWGVGGINIDGCRVGTETTRTTIKDLSQAHGNQFGKAGITYPTQGYKENQPGRFPANFIHDGSDEVVDLFPNTKGSSGSFSKEDYSDNEDGATNFKRGDFVGRNDSGSASRFFYCPKASKAERNRGCEELPIRQAGELQGRADGSLGGEPVTARNNHPTVKPIALMEYLVKLVSREGAVVLDPFAGSGSTLIACQNLGRKFIGCEMNEEYVKIIQARLGGCEVVKVEEQVKELPNETPKEPPKEVKKGLSKCCQSEIVKGYCVSCCENVV